MRLVILLLCLCGCIIERIDALLDNGVTYVPTSTAEASDGSGTDTSTGSTSSDTTSTVRRSPTDFLQDTTNRNANTAVRRRDMGVKLTVRA